MLLKRASIIIISICILVGVLQFGVILASPTGEVIHGIDLARLERIGTNWVRSNRISPDGKHVAVGTRDARSVYIFEIESGEPVWKGSHTAEIPSVAWSTDGKIIASGSLDGTIKIWDSATGDELKRIQTYSQVEWVIFSPDDKILYSYGRNDGVYMWDTSTWEIIKEKQAIAPSGNHIIDITSDGNRLAVIVNTERGNISVEIWDADTLETLGVLLPRTTMPVDRQIQRFRDVRWSQDDKHVAAGGDYGVVFWDADNYTNIKELGLPAIAGSIYAIAWSPEGSYFAVGCNTNNVYVFDTSDYQLVLRQPTGTTVLSVDWSSTGEYITVGTSGENFFRIIKWFGDN